MERETNQKQDYIGYKYPKKAPVKRECPSRGIQEVPLVLEEKKNNQYN